MTDVTILEGKNIKAGDTEPDLRLQLIDDGVSKSLSGFTATLTLSGANSGTKIVDAQSVSIDNSPDGIVSYSWQAGDTDTAEVYDGEVTIDDGAGTVLTFPNDTTFRVFINEKL